MTLLTLLQPVATSFPTVEYNPLTGDIAISASPLFGAVGVEQNVVIITSDNRGGWLPHHKRKEITSTKAAKIKAKRERREEYVMLKIWNELKGIEDISPELAALMAEFETPEEVLRSAEEIQKMLKDAYMQNVVIREMRIAEQDKEDEDEIMALLSLTL